MLSSAAARSRRCCRRVCPRGLTPSPAPTPSAGGVRAAPPMVPARCRTGNRSRPPSRRGSIARSRASRFANASRRCVTIWVLGDFTNTRDTRYAQLRRWIEQDGVGALSMSLGSPIEVAAKVNALQRRARVPLLVRRPRTRARAARGRSLRALAVGRRLGDRFPDAMAIGAPARDSDAYDGGVRDRRREARAVGIHVAFAPVVDVNNNPNIPSSTCAPSARTRHGRAAVGGVRARAAGRRAPSRPRSIFPGTATPTPIRTRAPVVERDRARLDTVELVPFRAAIHAGVRG